MENYTMKLKKMQFTPKQRKIMGIRQIYFIQAQGREPIFLEERKNDSINILRQFFEPDFSDEKKEQFKEFWEIIHQNYLKGVEATRKTAEKKKEYYETLRIKAREKKIERLQEEIKRLRG